MRRIWVIIGMVVLFGGCTRTKMHYGTGYYAPAWSPDGRRIYYFRNDLTVKEIIPYGEGVQYEYEKNEWYICSCDTNGENRKEIYKVAEFKGKGGGGNMDVSPSGEIIYCFPKTKEGIWMMDTTGNNDHQILFWGKNPRWAYNYTKIIFEGDSTHRGIWLMDKNGENVIQILTEGSSPAFCDANEKVLYHIWPAEGYGMIYLYSFSDSSIDTLVEGTHPDWSPDGEKFVYHIGSGGNLYLYLLVDNTYKQILDIGYGYIIRFMPSSTAIIFEEGSSVSLTNEDGNEHKTILQGKSWIPE